MCRVRRAVASCRVAMNEWHHPRWFDAARSARGVCLFRPFNRSIHSGGVNRSIVPRRHPPSGRWRTKPTRPTPQPQNEEDGSRSGRAQGYATISRKAVPYSTVSYRTVRYRTMVQSSTVPYSTVRYRTVRSSTQHGALHHTTLPPQVRDDRAPLRRRGHDVGHRVLGRVVRVSCHVI